MLRAHKGKASEEQVDALTGLVLGERVAVLCVALSPDGKRLAAAGYDRTVRLFDTESGQETHTFAFNVPAINAVTFSPDSNRIAAGGGKDSGECAIWKLEK